MQSYVHVNRSSTKITPRMLQIAGMFDMQASGESVCEFRYNMPIDENPWHIGAIVGPSGSGKSTILRNRFGIPSELVWPKDKCVIDGFGPEIPVKDIVAALSSVGFSSPPSWMRSFHCLSNGEQFRCSVARTLLESKGVSVIDEFTSVVDRQVAQFGCHAIQKLVRAKDRQLVVGACHYDIIDWLQPDWVLDTRDFKFQWRSLRRRPEIKCEIIRVHRAAWELFKKHHYLDSELSPQSYCFCLLLDKQPVAFTAVISFPHAKRPGWREHRTVCLPDYQGCGIGHILADFVASLFAATCKPYRSTTTHPGMIYARHRSSNWRMTKSPAMRSKIGSSGLSGFSRSASTSRAVASFEYIGPKNSVDAGKYGVSQWQNLI